MSLLEQLSQVVTQQAVGAAATKSGLSEGMAAKMMPMAMAVLMKGLKNNASSPEGAEKLARALEKHDGSLLNDVDRLGDDAVLADGKNILGHILGGKLSGVEMALAQAAGANPDQVKNLLAMAAPAVLASLGRAKREQGLDVAGLSGLLAEEGVRAEREAPSELGGLMGLLDRDGDGDIKEEALAIGTKMLGGLFGKR